MSCSGTTPDVSEFPLTACEYELFGFESAYVYLFTTITTIIDHRYGCLFPPRRFFFRDNSPSEYEIFEIERL